MNNFIVRIGARERKILATSAYNAIVVAYPHKVWSFKEKSEGSFTFYTDLGAGRQVPAFVRSCTK